MSLLTFSQMSPEQIYYETLENQKMRWEVQELCEESATNQSAVENLLNKTEHQDVLMRPKD